MQPYFLPYVGYFQLIGAVDTFVVYDNIKYTKKGWINRNRMLLNGKDVMFSLPLKNDSDSLHVRERLLSTDFDREKLINQLSGAYRKAPFYADTFPFIESLIRFTDNNLFNYIHNSITKICAHLGLSTEIRTSSSLPIDHELRSQEKVIAICNALGAGTYINAIGGMELYSREAFKERNIKLSFLKSNILEYSQFGGEFVPWLSIVDVLMFNERNKVREITRDGYRLI